MGAGLSPKDYWSEADSRSTLDRVSNAIKVRSSLRYGSPVQVIGWPFAKVVITNEDLAFSAGRWCLLDDHTGKYPVTRSG
jgi:hypothetical protein